MALEKGELALFRHGALQKFQLMPDDQGSLTNEIIAQPDGSILAAFDDGLVGFRQGKVQRMTTTKRSALRRHLFFR